MNDCKALIRKDNSNQSLSNKNNINKNYNENKNTSKNTINRFAFLSGNNNLNLFANNSKAINNFKCLNDKDSIRNNLNNYYKEKKIKENAITVNNTDNANTYKINKYNKSLKDRLNCYSINKSYTNTDIDCNLADQENLFNACNNNKTFVKSLKENLYCENENIEKDKNALRKYNIKNINKEVSSKKLVINDFPKENFNCLSDRSKKVLQDIIEKANNNNNNVN